MPRKRANAGKPGAFGRGLAGIAGLVFGAIGAIGVYQALQDTSGKANVIGSLAVLLPTVLLIRYALTGQIKV